MSIVIKGVEMPNACCHCPCSDSTGCAVTGRVMTTEEMAGMLENIGDCPAHPLPEKHGRLIDADAFAKHLREAVKSVEAFAPQMATALEAAVRDLEDSKKTPTIVEAEGEEEGET